MEIKRGTRISLNKQKRAFYFQGPDGINLIADKVDTAIIPDEIEDIYLDMIKKAVRGNHLVIGWAKEKEVEIPDRRMDRELLDKAVRKMVPFLEKVARTSGRGDEAPVARLEKLIRLEKDGKNRKTVIKNIEGILSNMAGISSVIEDEIEEIKINVV